MESCPFCQILEDDQLDQIIMRGENVTAIKKLYKPDNVDFLIIPNRHIVNLKDPQDREYRNVVLCEMVDMANMLSQGRDWNIHINNGPKADQTVFHLHAHIRSNEPFKSWFPESESFGKTDGNIGNIWLYVILVVAIVLIIRFMAYK